MCVVSFKSWELKKVADALKRIPDDADVVLCADSDPEMRDFVVCLNNNIKVTVKLGSKQK